jgi:hypothetical protein
MKPAPSTALLCALAACAAAAGGADDRPEAVTHAFLATGAQTCIRSGDGKVTWSFPHPSPDGWARSSSSSRARSRR